MSQQSPLEERLSAAISQVSPGLFVAAVPQYAFAFAPDPERSWAGGRRWRADFAWPDVRVMVEVEGIFGNKSRHRTASGYHADCEKYRAATILDYALLRYTSRDIATDEGCRRAAEEIVGFVRRKISEQNIKDTTPEQGEGAATTENDNSNHN